MTFVPSKQWKSKEWNNQIQKEIKETTDIKHERKKEKSCKKAKNISRKGERMIQKERYDRMILTENYRQRNTGRWKINREKVTDKETKKKLTNKDTERKKVTYRMIRTWERYREKDTDRKTDSNIPNRKRERHKTTKH